MRQPAYSGFVAPNFLRSLNWPMLATVVCWGFNFVAIKLVYEQISPSAAALGRCILMWLALVLICRIRGESLKYPPGQKVHLLGIGFLSLGVYIVLFMLGMNYTSPADGAIVLATSPIFTALIAVLYGQDRFSWGSLAGAMIALCGVGMVVSVGVHGGSNAVLGNSLVLASSLVWAWSVVLARPRVQALTPLQALTLSMPGSLLVLLPWGIADLMATKWSKITVQTWLAFGHLTFLAGVVGFLGFYAGLRRSGAAGVMLYQFFVPPVAAACGALLLAQPILPVQVVGFAAVIAGVWWSSRSRRPAMGQLTQR